MKQLETASKKLSKLAKQICETVRTPNYFNVVHAWCKVSKGAQDFILRLLQVRAGDHSDGGFAFSGANDLRWWLHAAAMAATVATVAAAVAMSAAEAVSVAAVMMSARTT